MNRPVYRLLNWLLIVGLMLVCGQCYAGDKVRIIMRAFIPSDVPGASDIAPITGEPGKFMLTGPIGTSCYDTDSRSFSNNPSASARITTDFTIEVTDPPVVTPTQKADRFIAGLSRRINCSTGAVEATGKSDLSSCSMGTPARTPKQVQIITSCSGANPLLLVAPDIDYGGSFIYDLRKFALSFEGDIGAFPSFEIYGSLNGGPLVQLLAKTPETGAGPFKLIDLWMHINTRHIVIPPTKLAN